MDDEQLLNVVREAFRNAAPEVVGAISMHSKLEDLGIDSIKALEMAGHVEERLNIRFNDDELAHVSSIGDLVKLVKAVRVDGKEVGHECVADAS